MKNDNPENKLAALAVFRAFYNQKTDVYALIEIFAREIISKKSLYSFSTPQLSQYLKSEYDFEIPDAVVTSALARIKGIIRQGTNWSIPALPTPNIGLSQKQLEIQGIHKSIKKSLLDFSKERGVPEEKEELILDAFRKFLIDERNGSDYSDIIAGFVIANIDDSGFQNALNQVREGVILHAGLQYSGNINEIGNWNKKLTLILDTEILFNFAGLNGELPKKWFLDLYKFIQDINSKSKERMIVLRYFPNVTQEIQDFFYAAEKIVEYRSVYDMSKVAMQSIVNGCKNTSDVLEKKAQFVSRLASYLIEEMPFPPDPTEEDLKHWIFDSQSLQRLYQNPEYFEKPIEDYLGILNAISRLRKNVETNRLEDSKFIMISGKSTILSLARDPEFRKFGEIPFAVSTNYLTANFWFKMSRGFGLGGKPTSFDVIGKAQMSLSSHLNESLHNVYLDYERKTKSGELSPQAATQTFAMFRREIRRPEDISASNIVHELDIINLRDVEEFSAKYDHAISASEEYKEQNVELSKQMQELDQKMAEEKLHFLEKQIEQLTQQIELLKGSIRKNIQIIDGLNARRQQMRDALDSVLSKAESKILVLKISLSFALLLTALIIIYLLSLNNLGYNDLKAWHFFAAIGFEYVLLVVLSTLLEKSITFKDAHAYALKGLMSFFESRRIIVVNQLMSRANASNEMLEAISEDIAQIEAENRDLSLQIADTELQIEGARN